MSDGGSIPPSSTISRATSETAPESETETEAVALTGTIVRVFSARAGSAKRSVWSAGAIRTSEGEDHRFSGKVFAIKGLDVELHGEWIEEAQYGKKFKVSAAQVELDINSAGLVGYLTQDRNINSGGNSVSISRGQAEALIAELGENFDHALRNQPTESLPSGTIDPATLAQLARTWRDNHPANAVRSWLYSYGLSTALVEQLVAAFYTSAVSLLQSDPYQLLDEDYPGFYFKNVDQIARAMGVSAAHPSRSKAIFAAVLQAELSFEGHCWSSQSELLEKAHAKFDLAAEVTADDLPELLANSKLSHLVAPTGERLIGLSETYEQESKLAKIFNKGRRPNPHASAESAENELADAAQTSLEQGNFNPQQRQAIEQAIDTGLSLISGRAGSGKTHAVCEIARIYNRCGYQVALAAPTGKAARRMSEVSGMPAQTIHRLLGYDGKKFEFDQDNPLGYGVIIIDECSMLDVELGWNLFAAIDLRRTAVVLVGDHNQLPPVGPGNLLRDLIDTPVLPTTILDEIVRQAGQLPVKCAGILAGEVADSTPADENNTVAWAVVDKLETPEQVLDYLTELFDFRLERRDFDILRDVQVLSPKNAGPLGVDALNRMLQKIIQKKLWGVEVDLTADEPALLKYDKVIQTRNNYQLGEDGIMNGTIGTIVNRTAKGTLTIDFEGEEVKITARSANRRDIQLAYALTIHKAQGSEFPCAVLVLHDSHSFMHNRNLFYTGITRARKTAITVGSGHAITRCAEKLESDKRRTFLSQLLSEKTDGSVGVGSAGGDLVSADSFSFGADPF